MGSGAASLSPDARVVAEELYDEGIPTISVGRMGSGTGVPSATPGKW
jgi:L-asparaginase